MEGEGNGTWAKCGRSRPRSIGRSAILSAKATRIRAFRPSGCCRRLAICPASSSMSASIAPCRFEERDILRGYVTRRGKGEPLQYITGYAAFRHIQVKVRPGVLIPRPETEVLVSEALSLLPAAHRRVALDSTIDAWEGDALIAAEAAAAEAAQDGSDDASETLKRSQQAISAYWMLSKIKATVMAAIAPMVPRCRRAPTLAGRRYLHGRARVHRVLGGLRASRYARHRNRHRARGGGACQGRHRRVGAFRPRPHRAGRFGFAGARRRNGPARFSGFQPSLRSHGGALPRYLGKWPISSLRSPWTAAPTATTSFAVCCLGRRRRFVLAAVSPSSCTRPALMLRRSWRRRAGFHQVRIVDDLAGRPRVLTGVKPGV